MIEIIYILCLIIIIKSEIWTITHCLGLGYETMVCAVCLSVFLWIGGWSKYRQLWDLHTLITIKVVDVCVCNVLKRTSRLNICNHDNPGQVSTLIHPQMLLKFHKYFVTIADYRNMPKRSIVITWATQDRRNTVYKIPCTDRRIDWQADNLNPVYYLMCGALVLRYLLWRSGSQRKRRLSHT